MELSDEQGEEFYIFRRVDDYDFPRSKHGGRKRRQASNFMCVLKTPCGVERNYFPTTSSAILLSTLGSIPLAFSKTSNSARSRVSVRTSSLDKVSSAIR